MSTLLSIFQSEVNPESDWLRRAPYPCPTFDVGIKKGIALLFFCLSHMISVISWQRSVFVAVMKCILSTRAGIFSQDKSNGTNTMANLRSNITGLQKNTRIIHLPFVSTLSVKLCLHTDLRSIMTSARLDTFKKQRFLSRTSN